MSWSPWPVRSPASLGAAGASPGRLSGRVVALARAAAATDPLLLRMEAEGARVLVWPTLRFDPPRDPAALEAAVEDLHHLDWVLFTSPRAVRALSAVTPPPRAGHPRVGAVGESMALALRDAGWPVHMMADAQGAQGLVDAFRQRNAEGLRVLFPAASRARDTLERGLGELGIEVIRVEAYETVVTPLPTGMGEGDLAEGVDAVVFASPSGVEAIAKSLTRPLADALRDVAVISIGRTTGEALRDRGIADYLTAEIPSTAGLAEAVLESLSPQSARS